MSPLRGTYSGPKNATLEVSVEMRRLAAVSVASPAHQLHHQQAQQQQ